MQNKIVRFWVVPVPDNEEDQGWVEWSDGEKEFAFGVLGNSELITPPQRLYLQRELTLHIPGLTSEKQAIYLYDGVLFAALMTDSGEVDDGHQD